MIKFGKIGVFCPVHGQIKKKNTQLNQESEDRSITSRKAGKKKRPGRVEA